MRVKIGEVEMLFRYPVKSMRGESLESAAVSWHGLDGDRRLALRRIGDGSGFPWLTGGKLPALLLYTPERRDAIGSGGLPSHVRTPEGELLPVFSPELAAEIGKRHGTAVEMTYLNRGIFDEASVSLITSTTAAAATRLADTPADVRRFRPNIVIASSRAVAFEEDEWIRGVLTFGNDSGGAAVTITNRDERCSMVNFDPDSGESTPALLKSIVRMRNNKLGVYGTVTQPGLIAIGQSIFLER
jgi:uncharacterized protein